MEISVITAEADDALLSDLSANDIDFNSASLAGRLPRTVKSSLPAAACMECRTVPRRTRRIRPAVRCVGVWSVFHALLPSG